MDGQTGQGRHLASGPLRLAPVEGAELQWWFAQGRVSGATAHLRVMVALFRAEYDGVEGAALLTQTLDETTGESHAQVRITPGTLEIEDRIAQHVARSRVAPWLPGGLRLALWRHRRDVATLLARESALTVDPRGPRFGAAPFAASWAGVLLGHDPAREALRLTLPLGPGAGLEAQVTLPGAVMDTDAQPLTSPLGARFQSQSAPALPLTGRIGHEAVTGTLWLDRQWGAMDGWLFRTEPRGAALLGWDWFGLTFDDDWQLMLTRHHLRPRGETLAECAVVFENGTPVGLPRGFTATPSAWWDSPRTGARYPVGWDVAVPDLALTARLDPLAPDQECVLPGGLSVWEGAGRFTGVLEGHAVEGAARMEAMGYAAVLTLAERIRRRRVAGI